MRYDDDPAARVACGHAVERGGGAGPDRSVPSPNLIIELKAQNSAFSETELQAPAYSQVSVILDNADKDLPHSFSLYRTPNGESPVFVGGLVPGQQTRTAALSSRGRAGAPASSGITMRSAVQAPVQYRREGRRAVKNRGE